jgi:hypothetical protein
VHFTESADAVPQRSFSAGDRNQTRFWCVRQRWLKADYRASIRDDALVQSCSPWHGTPTSRPNRHQVWACDPSVWRLGNRECPAALGTVDLAARVITSLPAC